MPSTARDFISAQIGTRGIGLQKKPDLTKRRAAVYLSLAALLTFVVPIIQTMVEQRSGIAKPLLALPFLGISSGVAVVCFTHEHVKVGKRSFVMLVSGLVLAGVSFILFANHGGATYRGSVKSLPAIISIFDQSIVIPFYEELAVRTFLFIGVARYLGFVFSAIAVSVLFGLAHGQISVFAFCMSLLLCYLTYRDVGVFDRSVLHGSYNFVLIILIMMFGSA